MVCSGIRRLWFSLTGLILVLLLGGCAAVHTSIAKKDLDVQTKMSDSIFLDPVGPDKRSIFVQVRNTSDKANFDTRLLCFGWLEMNSHLAMTGCCLANREAKISAAFCPR